MCCLRATIQTTSVMKSSEVAHLLGAINAKRVPSEVEPSAVLWWSLPEIAELFPFKFDGARLGFASRV